MSNQGKESTTVDKLVVPTSEQEESRIKAKADKIVEEGFGSKGLESMFGPRTAEEAEELKSDCFFDYPFGEEEEITHAEVVAFTSGVAVATVVIATALTGVFLLKRLKKSKQAE